MIQLTASIRFYPMPTLSLVSDYSLIIGKENLYFIFRAFFEIVAVYLLVKLLDLIFCIYKGWIRKSHSLIPRDQFIDFSYIYQDLKMAQVEIKDISK